MSLEGLPRSLLQVLERHRCADRNILLSILIRTVCHMYVPTPARPLRLGGHLILIELERPCLLLSRYNSIWGKKKKKVWGPEWQLFSRGGGLYRPNAFEGRQITGPLKKKVGPSYDLTAM